MSATATVRQHENPSAAIKPQLRVLLVEDNPGDRDLILQELGKGEFDVISDVVQTAEEFRQRMKTNIPDVVLADYNLGQWRGMEALEILRADPATAHTPVIAISANAMALDIERGMGAGFFRYITKPIKVDEFMDAIEAALEYAQRESAQIT